VKHMTTKSKKIKKAFLSNKPNYLFSNDFMANKSHYKIIKIKKICFHYTTSGLAEYYDELLTTRPCPSPEIAGDIVCSYLKHTTSTRKLARIITTEPGGVIVA
jgi:hypothetical protein